MKWCFMICKSMYILKVHSIHYNVDFIFNTKQTVQKMPSFFFRELQLIPVLLLICDSYINWSTRFVPLKLCLGFSIFGCFVFIKVYIIVQQNASTLWLKNFIIHFKIKITEKLSRRALQKLNWRQTF